MEPPFGDAADAERRNTQQKPQSGERQTDLPIEVQRHIAVVPHVPSHDKIVRNAHGEFQRRDEQSAAETLEQPGLWRRIGTDQIESHGGGTAGEGHGPVGISTAYNFQQTIGKSPQQKEPAEFIGLVMQFQGITSLF